MLPSELGHCYFLNCLDLENDFKELQNTAEEESKILPQFYNRLIVNFSLAQD